MGSSDFAAPALRALTQHPGVQIPLVITQPDRPRDRGKKLLPTPVKQFAESAGIPVMTPERLSDQTVLETLRKTAPDLIVVASYGKILPKSILEVPGCGCVNIHASLLPKYRGAAPIRWAIAAGEPETGVTLIYMGEGLDDGDMIAQRRVPISSFVNAGASVYLKHELSPETRLTRVLAEAGAELLLEMLPRIADGTAPRIPQDEALATYTRKIAKEDAHIDFSQSEREVLRRIRIANPNPGAYAMIGDCRVKIVSARIPGGEELRGAMSESLPGTEAGAEAGTVLSVSPQGVFVQTGDGVLVIDAIGMPGKKPMLVADYLRGNAFPKGRLE